MVIIKQLFYKVILKSDLKNAIAMILNFTQTDK